MTMMDETDYLMGGENNAKHLEESIKQAKSTVPSQEHLTDANYVIRLLQNMDKYELDGIRCECDYLIDNILNSYSD